MDASPHSTFASDQMQPISGVLIRIFNIGVGSCTLKFLENLLPEIICIFAALRSTICCIVLRRGVLSCWKMLLFPSAIYAVGPAEQRNETETFFARCKCIKFFYR